MCLVVLAPAVRPAEGRHAHLRSALQLASARTAEGEDGGAHDQLPNFRSNWSIRDHHRLSRPPFRIYAQVLAVGRRQKAMTPLGPAMLGLMDESAMKRAENRMKGLKRR